LRSLAAPLICAAALAGCGGGGSSAVLDLGVIVEGQSRPGLVAGQTATIGILVGQSIELDANEPVVWAFSVNGSPLFASGTTVIVQGLAITQMDLSPSRVVIDTELSGPTRLPVVVNLTATSTLDAAEVASVVLQIQ
jgi:hypothetical protein